MNRLITLFAILLLCFVSPFYYAEDTNTFPASSEEVTELNTDKELSVAQDDAVLDHNTSQERKEHHILVVKHGDTLIRMLTELGMDIKTATDAYNTLRKVFDARNLKVDQYLELTGNFDTQSHRLVTLDTLVVKPSYGTEFILYVSEDGQFAAKKEVEKLIPDVKVVIGVVRGSVSSSMIKSGVPRRLAGEVINRMSHIVNFRIDVRKGDTFSVKYDVSKAPDGDVVKIGNLLSATFQTSHRTYKIYRFNDNYYNEKGEVKKTILDVKPLAMRNATVLNNSSSGVDYAAPEGTAIYASGSGIIETAQQNNERGNYIKIRHNDVYETAYSHLQGFAKGIIEGTQVRRGQVIGYVGNTGKAKQSFLHFEILRSGQNINPLKSNIIIDKDLSGGELAEFKKEMKRIDSIQGSDLPNTPDEYENNNELKIVEDSITLTYGTKEYFYVYTGSDISKEKLDNVIDEIRNDIGYNAGFSIHDNEIATELAYMNWVSMASYSSFPQSFHDGLKHCYNYRREHSLVEADSTDLVVFSNYELDKIYQENKRNGTYKYCNPKEFVQQNIQKVRDIDNQRKDEHKKLKQISSNRQLQQQCLDIIRTKFRYVNDLSFNDNIHIDQRNDTYTFSGVLNVEATNGTKATAEYKCIYSDSKKEFVDWFVGELESTTLHNHSVKIPTRKPEYAHGKNQEDLVKQYPLCNPRYLFFTQDKCRENNINGNFFRVLQQTPDGTLVSFIKSPDYVLLISKNPKDASLPDNSPIYDGSFAVDGTYQYTSVLGSIKTVKKLKRLK